MEGEPSEPRGGDDGVEPPTLAEIRRVKREANDDDSDGGKWGLKCSWGGDLVCSFCKEMALATTVSDLQNEISARVQARYEKWANEAGVPLDFIPWPEREVLAQHLGIRYACSEALALLVTEAAQQHRQYGEITVDMVFRVSAQLRGPSGFLVLADPETMPQASAVAKAEIRSLESPKKSTVEVVDLTALSDDSEGDDDSADQNVDLAADEGDQSQGPDTNGEATRKRQWRQLLSECRPSPDQLDRPIRGQRLTRMAVSKERARELGDACEQFIRQFPEGCFVVETPNVPKTWSLAYAIQRALALDMGSQAPSLASLYWLYRGCGNRSGVDDEEEPPGARDWVSADRVMTFEKLGRVSDWDRKLVVFGILFNRGDPATSEFAKYAGKRSEEADRFLWICRTRGPEGNWDYMPVIDPGRRITNEMRREYNRKVADANEGAVEAILYLLKALEDRGEKFDAMTPMQATRWVRVLSSRPRPEWDDLVNTYLYDTVATKKGKPAEPTPEPDPNAKPVTDYWLTEAISEEQARQISPAHGEFVKRFPNGMAALDTSGHQQWCMFFALHRALVVEFGDDAPDFFELFREYVRLGREAHAYQDLGARHNFRIETASVFVNRVMVRRARKAVQVGLVKPIVDMQGQEFAWLYDNGNAGQGLDPPVTIWILYKGGNHYETVMDHEWLLEAGNEEMFDRKVLDQDSLAVDAILFLDTELQKRDLSIADVSDADGARWMAQLRNEARARWPEWVREEMGEPKANNILDAQNKYGDPNGRDDMWGEQPTNRDTKTSGTTTEGTEIWRGSGNDGLPIFIPRNRDAERYTVVRTRHGNVAVPTSTLEMSENMKAYMPAPVRLYLQSLSEARLPDDIPEEVSLMLRNLLGTVNHMMKISCQPIYRNWEKTHHPLLGVVLIAATNGTGQVFDEVETRLIREDLVGLLSPAKPWAFDEKENLILEGTDRIICKAGKWKVPPLADNIHRDSARKLPEGEARFRELQAQLINRNGEDPRILSHRTDEKDEFGRPVIRVLGELFSEDREADEEDAQRVPLDVFTRGPEQRAFAQKMGCTMHHEPESRAQAEDSLELGADVPGLESDTRRQVVNDVRRMTDRIIVYFSRRSSIAVDPRPLVDQITNEIIAMEDSHTTDDSEDGTKRVERGFLYWFVGNRNRKRVNHFLRRRVREYLHIQQGIARLPGMDEAMERDLNLLGPQLLRLVVANDSTRSVPRKWNQGVTRGGHSDDVSEFLRNNPDPVEEIIRGKKTSSTPTAKKRPANPSVSPSKSKGSSGKTKPAHPRKARKATEAEKTLKSLTELLGGQTRDGESMVDAVRRLVASGSGNTPQAQPSSTSQAPRTEADGDEANPNDGNGKGEEEWEEWEGLPE